MKNRMNYIGLFMVVFFCTNPLWSQCEFDEVIFTSPDNDYNEGDEAEISAWTSIQASNIISSGANIVYASNGSIQLNDGFFAAQESDFLARLGCLVNTAEPNFKTFLTVSPNPVRDRIYVEYVFEKNHQVSITLLNSVGQLVKTLLSKRPQNSGFYQYNWSLNDLPAGMYVLHLNYTEGEYADRILKIE